jgi:hypothetical protein
LLGACLLRPLPSNGSCLQSHYLAAAVVVLLISRSLLSNGCICHNIKMDHVETWYKVSAWTEISEGRIQRCTIFIFIVVCLTMLLLTHYTQSNDSVVELMNNELESMGKKAIMA